MFKAHARSRRHLLLPATITLWALTAGLLSACQSSSTADDELSPPPEPATASDPYAIDWLALDQALGQHPYNSPFLQAPGLNARLHRLLGPQDYALALQNLEVSSPLSVERNIYFITGYRQHQGGVEAVAIAMDRTSHSIKVWLLHHGHARIFAEPDASFPWPRDVQTMIGHPAGH